LKLTGDVNQKARIMFQKFELDWTTLKDIAFIRTDGIPEKAYALSDFGGFYTSHFLSK
jgi:hypothetical protein